MANPLNSGIYEIRNKVTHKRYVGSTINLVRRREQHWTHLRNGIHCNLYLQSSWDKHGESAFEFRIIGKCYPERLIELEQEVIDHLKPEYNLAKVAGSSLGIKRTEETRRKISLALT